MKSRKKFFLQFFFFEFFNKDLQSLSVELTHDMGIIRKLSAWSSEKKSQKFEKSTFKKKILDSAKLLLHFGMAKPTRQELIGVRKNRQDHISLDLCTHDDYW